MLLGNASGASLLRIPGMTVGVPSVSSSAFASYAGVSGVSFRYDATVLSSLWQLSTLATPVAVNTDPVGGWVDLLNGLPMIQATAAKRGVYTTGVFLAGTVPGVNFDGVSKFLATASNIFAQSNTTYLVYKLGAATLNQTMISSQNAGANQQIYVNGTVFLTFTAGTGLASLTVPDIAIHTLRGQFAGAASQLWLDGASIKAGNAGSQSLDGITLGASPGGATGFANVSIGLALGFNRTLSAGEDTAVMTQIRAVFGTP